jgi:hypothetical protein
LPSQAEKQEEVYHTNNEVKYLVSSIGYIITRVKRRRTERVEGKTTRRRTEVKIDRRERQSRRKNDRAEGTID